MYSHGGFKKGESDDKSLCMNLSTTPTVGISPTVKEGSEGEEKGCEREEKEASLLVLWF